MGGIWLPCCARAATDRGQSRTHCERVTSLPRCRTPMGIRFEHLGYGRL
jgi:hypothetical protein